MPGLLQRRATLVQWLLKRMTSGRDHWTGWLLRPGRWRPEFDYLISRIITLCDSTRVGIEKRKALLDLKIGNGQSDFSLTRNDHMDADRVMFYCKILET